MMLDHMGETAAARRIEAAVLKVYREGRWLTADVGGKATTKEFTQAVIDAMN
jgi:isocitrate/isopropylmalate dehydrogenase